MPTKVIPMEAIDRIVKAVGIQLFRNDDNFIGPPDPNRDLNHRLHQTLMWYELARERRTDADKKLQVRHLEAIFKTTTKLRNLLRVDQKWEWLKDSEFDALAFELDRVLPKARSEIDELEMKLEYGDDYRTAELYHHERELRDLIRSRSPFEWLAGSYLANDYRACFQKEPKLQRATDGQLSGPYIRFVEQVLIEFDVKNGRRPYSREAIAKALTNVRGRRQPAPSA